MARRKATAEAVGKVFARRLREARNARGWTQDDLSRELSELDAPMDRTTIAKLEKGQRQARIEELIAIAAALDVAPVHLLVPFDGAHSVALTPRLDVGTEKARRWIRGREPLKRSNQRFYWFQSPGDMSDVHLEDPQELANYLARSGFIGVAEQESGNDG